MLVKLTTLPPITTLEQFDFEAAAGVPKARVDALTGLAFIERREDVTYSAPAAPARRIWQITPDDLSNCCCREQHQHLRACKNVNWHT